MKQQTVTHLVVAAGGNDATNRIIDELQRGGLSVSAATADTRQELATLLKQPQWEAIVCFDNCRISVPVVLGLVALHAQSIPVILVTSAEKVIDLLPMLNQGIADVIPEEQSKRLLLSVQREAANSRLNRQLAVLEMNKDKLEDQYCAVLSSSTSPMTYIHDGTHLYCNQSYAALFGFESTTAVTSTPFLNLVQVQDHSLIKTLLAQPSGKEESLAVGILLSDGTEGDMMLTFTRVEFQKKSCIQITGRPLMGKVKEKSPPAQIASDLLGSLANDEQFVEQLDAAINKAVEEEAFSSLLVIALNDDFLVHAKEEKARLNLMFSDITRFLKGYVQKPFTVARLDAHIFGIILAGGDNDEVTALNALIKSSANKHFGIAGSLALREQSCTVGSTYINGREKRAEYVLAQASRNLKLSKLDKIKQLMLKGKPETTSDSDLLEYLMMAITQKRFKLLYQPVVHIKGANHKGYEVLTRMLDGDGMEILPEAFIRVANQNGIGEKLDKLIITMALESLELSTQAGPLIINVANNTLMSRTFLPWLNKKLAKLKIPPDLFAIAISETDIHNNEGHVIDFCHGLNAAGWKFVISHFGCSLDPYAVLAEIKPDLVKLDTSLLKDIGTRPMQRTTLQTLVTNLHNRGLLVVAPQVESLAILPILWDTGIDYVQGYFLQAPSQEMNYNFVVEEEITLSAGRI